MTRTLRATKGHGTENDFVLLDDRMDALDLDAGLVRALCDRRAGIGGDGVIRVAPSSSLPEGRAGLVEDPAARWFMDYRNADGSISEMCGNGVRVFAHYLRHLGEWDGTGTLSLGTRAGVRRVVLEDSGWYAVDMGPWRITGGAAAVAAGADAEVSVAGLAGPRPALSLDLGNPHTVLALADPAVLAELDLTKAPIVSPTPPHGTNVEIVVPLGEEELALAGSPAGGTSGALTAGRLRMRVHERGVGETRSCGTGACAAALAARSWAGPGALDVWFVEVPGGVVRVTALADDRVELAGPAALVAEVEIDLDALSER